MSVRATAFLLLALAPLACGAQVVVLNDLYHEIDVQPGRLYEDTVELLNQSDAPAEVKLYQTDYSFSADGRVLYGEPAGKLPRSNASWITISPVRATIPPKERLKVRLLVRAPDDPQLKGTFWSIVMVEPVAPDSPESASQPTAQPGLTIRQVVRYALQIATTIGSSGTTQLKFAGLRLAADGGKRVLEIDAENSGERTYRAKVWVDLYDSRGGYVGKFEAGDRRLYPGTAARFTADLTGVSDASYKALILVDCGDDNVFGANVNLVLKP
jgi:hypothetical protein